MVKCCFQRQQRPNTYQNRNNPNTTNAPITAPFVPRNHAQNPNGYQGNRPYHQANRVHVQPNARHMYQGAMQNGTYHHRSPYTPQPNANGVNQNNGIIIEGAAPHMNGEAASNPINVDPYNGAGDDLQSQQVS